MKVKIQLQISFSSRTLVTAHTAKTTSKWFVEHLLLCLIRQPLEPHMESIGYFQEKDEKQWIQQYRRAEGSMVPQQCHRLIASMHNITDAVIWAKGAPTKYWVHKRTYFTELELFF